MNSLVSPPRNGNRGLPPPVSQAQDPRAALPRRFTTDSSRVPTLSSITSQQRPPEPQEYPTANQYKQQLLERKKLDYEKLREQRRRFEAEMARMEQQQEVDIAKIQEEIVRGHPSPFGLTGHQSEPTTPPEYRDTSSGFPSIFSRPNRYSMSSLASPPGLMSRSAQSGSQLASPPSGLMSHVPYEDHHLHQLPSRSVPASRRNSDDDEKDEALRQDPTSHRSTNALNRYSMPVTRRGNLYENLDQTNAAGFLFRDDDAIMDPAPHSTADRSTEDKFPQLYQKGTNMLSASTAAVDLANKIPGEGANNGGWGQISRHRPQQSLSALSTSQMSGKDPMSPNSASVSDSKALGVHNFRHSLDMNQYREAIGDLVATTTMSAPTSQAVTPPKLHSSYSSNDVPTMKNGATGPSNMTTSSGNANVNTNAHAQNHLHNHNASMGRIPLGAVKRHSRELSSDAHMPMSQQPAGASFPTIQSQLQANAPAFGPGPGPSSQAPTQSGAPVSSAMGSAPYPPYFPGGNFNPAGPPSGNGYDMNALSMGMNNMGINNYSPYNYHRINPIYSQQMGQQPPKDSQQRVMQQRRAQDNEVMNRLNSKPLEEYVGQIYDLCKDQHGCRYLQKQIEHRNPNHIHMIFLETSSHVSELMTDPFGNYLCQKLLEHCSAEERTILVQNASRAMVDIALNQHGTRALQKMIDCVTTQHQVQLIIEALQYQVVGLIQDLNGNHVIQKCLNKFSPHDAQFIFTAVGNDCVDVGTHRHGCCVLQRCIDHADLNQKAWLIAMITDSANELVQDPFGNYVLQYVVDLGSHAYTEPLVREFGGQIVELSRHKFSSNVIEKCLRCASDTSKDLMATELLIPGQMNTLLTDGFGNYVVQTALEHATYHMKYRLVEAIRPVIPRIKTTPHGRRLQAKIQTLDANRHNSSNTVHAAGQSTPTDQTHGQVMEEGMEPRGDGMVPTSILSPGAHHTPGVRGGRAFPSSNSLVVPHDAVGPPEVPRPRTPKSVKLARAKEQAQNNPHGQANAHPHNAFPGQHMPPQANYPPQPPRLNGYPTYPGPNGEGFF